MRMKKNLPVIGAMMGLLVASSAGYGQALGRGTTILDEAKPQKTAFAQRLTSVIVVDGRLDDAGWMDISAVGNFTQYAPNPGAMPSQKTSVRFAYDDAALYIGARMWDSAPDSILHQLSQRDETLNTDEFGIWISTFNDGLNAVRFATTPDGVQIDEQISPSGEDASWDAVWDVACRIDSAGWTAEFRIPWMAFRFAESTEQTWGMNMYRSIRRLRQENVWNPMDPTQQLLNQGGVLKGIQEIDPPLRLSLFPYLSAYATSNGTDRGSDYNGGMDLKVGLGNAFTMDMTLVPDFGQVVTDNLVLNLSPFEIRFDENRQFFKEGTELFNKSGLFYSRRIGEEGRLLNASKISGRTAGGLGLGLLQALATASEDTSLVSYTVAVADQNIANNGYITTTGTLVAREGSAYDAWVQSTSFDVRNPQNTWNVNGGGTMNRKFNAGPDEDDEGYTWNLAVHKMAGKFTFDLGHFVESENYDPNDLGYLQAPNEKVSFMTLNYRMVEPKGLWNRVNWSLSGFYNEIHTPRMFNNWFLEGGVRATTKAFNTWNLELSSQPNDGNNIFASRIDGLVWKEPSWYALNMWFSSDYRKRIALDLGYWYGGGGVYLDWKETTYRVAPRIRINDQAMLTYVWKINNRNNERGWLKLDPLGGESDQSIFGNRDNTELTQVLNLSYNFTNRMSLSTRIRHSWSQVAYKGFYVLNSSGVLEPITYFDESTTAFDVNYNAWSIDMVYRWFFAPGSELNLVWKNQLFQENVGEILPSTYVQNFSEMLESGFYNSLSIRIISYLDYSRFQQGLRGFQE